MFEIIEGQCKGTVITTMAEFHEYDFPLQTDADGTTQLDFIPVLQQRDTVDGGNEELFDNIAPACLASTTSTLVAMGELTVEVPRMTLQVPGATMEMCSSRACGAALGCTVRACRRLCSAMLTSSYTTVDLLHLTSPLSMQW